MNRPPQRTKKALDEQRSHWEHLLIMVMHKLQVKKVEINDDDLRALSASTPPGEQAYLISHKDANNPQNRFVLQVAYGDAERNAIIKPPPTTPVTVTSETKHDVVVSKTDSKGEPTKFAVQKDADIGKASYDHENEPNKFA